jgi:hypothetical protein
VKNEIEWNGKRYKPVAHYQYGPESMQWYVIVAHNKYVFLGEFKNSTYMDLIRVDTTHHAILRELPVLEDPKADDIVIIVEPP